MTDYKKGDIVLVLFPNSNLQTAKKRPALIVQADKFANQTAASDCSFDNEQQGAWRT